MQQSASMVTQGFGLLLAAVPEVQKLVEYRKEIDEGDDEQDYREAILCKAQEFGLSALSVLLPQAASLPAEEYRIPARQIAQAVALEFLARIPEDLTVRQALDKFSEWVGWDDFLVQYIDEYATTDRPPHFDERIVGGVGSLTLTVPGTEGEKTPVVFAVASRWTPIKELCEDIKAEAKEAFKDVTLTEPKTALEVGHYWYLVTQRGMSNEEIAWENLEARHPEMLDGRSERDWTPLYKAEMNRLHQLSGRSTDRLTQASLPVSGDSD